MKTYQPTNAEEANAAIDTSWTLGHGVGRTAALLGQIFGTWLTEDVSDEFHAGYVAGFAEASAK